MSKRKRTDTVDGPGPAAVAEDLRAVINDLKGVIFGLRSIALRSYGVTGLKVELATYFDRCIDCSREVKLCGCRVKLTDAPAAAAAAAAGAGADSVIQTPPKVQCGVCRKELKPKDFRTYRLMDICIKCNSDTKGKGPAATAAAAAAAATTDVARSTQGKKYRRCVHIGNTSAHRYKPNANKVVSCEHCGQRCCPDCRYGVGDADTIYCRQCVVEFPGCCVDGEKFLDDKSLSECVFCRGRVCAYHAIGTADSVKKSSVYCSLECADINAADNQVCVYCNSVFKSELRRKLGRYYQCDDCLTRLNSVKRLVVAPPNKVK